MPDGRPCLGLCGWHPVMCLGVRAPLIQRPRGERGSGDDGVADEDADGPLEHDVIAVGPRQPGQGLAAEDPGRGKVRGDVGGGGRGEDGVQ